MRKLHIPRGLGDKQINELIPRSEVSLESVQASVQQIIDDVAARGEDALRDQAARFDRVTGHSLKVPTSALVTSNLSPELLAAVKVSIERVRAVASANLPINTRVEVAPGALVSTRHVAVDSVGVYVPGGKAVYPSSVIMNVVPALVAGVKRVALASPPQADGLPHPTILAVANLLGVDEVYAIGGASAVAAFAHGVPSLEMEKVQLVTGPGNVFVATAKRLLRGRIGIDSEAGPTEILVLADSSAKARYVAADLISQAEHDEQAAAVLVTDSERLADEVLAEVLRLAAETPSRERVHEALGGIQSAVVVVPDWDTAIEVTNAYATEHLEIHSRRPHEDLARIKNAGAIFLGDYSPVSLGDYLAGSNHVLPTGQQAKFGPGLGVHTFLRPQQVIEYTEQSLRAVVKELEVFSDAEGLPAHGSAAQIRFREG